MTFQALSTDIGAGDLTVRGGAAILIGGDLATTGGVTVHGSAAVASDATLAGSTVRFDGELAGAFAGVRRINIVGNLGFGAGGGLSLAIDGRSGASVDYDQVAVAGAVDLTGASLALSDAGFQPGCDDEVVLISNDGTDAIVGAFQGMPEGASVALPGTGAIVTLTYVGGDGNDVALAQVDSEPPVIALLADITVNNDAGQCGAVVAYTPTATDNCGVADVSADIASGTQFPVGSTIVTVTATDAHGNSSSRRFTVTVIDAEAPAIAPDATDLTVECDGAGNLDALNNWLEFNAGAVATDNCGAVIWNHVFAGLSDGCGATGDAIVTFTATDASGNSSSTSATFRIVDTTAPELSWSIGGETIHNSESQEIKPNEVPVTIHVTAADLCGAATLRPVTVTCHKVTKKGKIIDK